MIRKRDKILRLIIAYKAVWGVLEVLIAVGFYRLISTNSHEPFRALAESLRLDPDAGAAGYFIAHVASIDNNLLYAFAGVIFLFGSTNLIESWGLHRRLRWAEWLTVIATSLLIPYETYHVIINFGFFKLFILIINALIVYYLAKHKELFKSRKDARSARERNLQ